MFLRNYWYVAATDAEIGRKPFRRIIMNEPVVFYRTEDGTPVALEDRCPHRRLPLSMGKLVGDDVLQCHYHGLRFDRTGACVRVPGQDMIPATAQGEDLSGGRALQVACGSGWAIRRWPIRRRSPITTGSTIRTWGAKSDYLHVECNWQLVNDNLLDLTHLAFVHETTIGNMALVEHAAVQVQRTPTGVQVTRWIIDQPAAADVQEGRRLHRQRRPLADHRLHAAVLHPARCRRDADRHRRAGGPPRRRHPDAQPQRHDAGDRDHHALLLGPGPRLRAARMPRLTERVFQQIKTAFLEDVSVFTAQQRNIELDPNAPQIDINADSGGIQARRIVDRLYDEEQAAASVAAE